MAMQPEFVKQIGQPLFPKTLWNRPVSRMGAGRLLIIGGHEQAFSLPQGIYQLADAAGAGDVQVLLPDSLRPLLGPLGIGIFLPSTGSGSLSKKSLGESLLLAEDYDATLIGPQLSNHSETMVFTDGFISKHQGQMILVEDALIAIGANPKVATNRSDVLIIVSLQELFKLITALGIIIKHRPERGLLNLVGLLHALMDHTAANYVLYGQDLIVASHGKVSVTPFTAAAKEYLPAIYGTFATFFIQNPANHYEGLTTAAYVLSQITPVIKQDSSLNAQGGAIRKMLADADW